MAPSGTVPKKLKKTKSIETKNKQKNILSGPYQSFTPMSQDIRVTT